jgi:membrane associated rhomboid family serine protease
METPTRAQHHLIYRLIFPQTSKDLFYITSNVLLVYTQTQYLQIVHTFPVAFVHLNFNHISLNLLIFISDLTQLEYLSIIHQKWCRRH